MSDPIAPLIDLLTDAFWDDPWFSTLAEGDAKRRRILHAMFDCTVRYVKRFGEMRTSSDHDAIACWLTPEHPTTSTWGLLRCGGWRVPLALGLRRLKPFAAHLDHVAALHEQLQPEPHLYLLLLAVQNAKHGQGVGGRLLDSVLREADDRALPCYLETFNPRNVGFYERHGFRVINESPSPNARTRIWSMRRLPNPVVGR